MSQIAQATIRQQLQMLREQTRLTGALHEAQVLQLKGWPLVVFQKGVSSEFTWDADKRVVVFFLKLPRKAKAQPRAWWKQRVDVLNEWVQELLGSDWIIRVKVGSDTYAGSVKLSGAGSKPMTVKVDNGSADAGTKGSSAHRA